MAHKTYSFDFFNIINNELNKELATVEITPLDDDALRDLGAYQIEKNVSQGVYVVNLSGVPVYVGKANDVQERLSQHKLKLSGRKNINMNEIGYQAILLEQSMSTATNETLLISLFKKDGQAEWNSGGFGPKDPGKERDTTKPGKFDAEHPIRSDWPVHLDGVEHTVGAVLAAAKKQVPFVFRYEIAKADVSKPIVLTAASMNAVEVMEAVVRTLGAGWKGAVLSFGMVLYKSDKQYPHGREITP